MTGLEIKTQLDMLYSKLVKLVVFGELISDLEEYHTIKEEIAHLTKICPHDYGDDGFCIYCRFKKFDPTGLS